MLRVNCTFFVQLLPLQRLLGGLLYRAWGYRTGKSSLASMNNIMLYKKSEDVPD